jgi:hypothetical protein
MVAFWGRTYITYLLIGNVMANLAKLYLVPQFTDTVAETFHISSLLVKQVQH